MMLGAAFALCAGACGGSSGTTGTAGNSGSPGSAGNGAGTAGTSGAGTAGTSGAGTAGNSGTPGSAGNSGNPGTAGTSASGSAGTSGAGTAGNSGTPGTAGTSASGTAGKGGTNGTGTAGTSGTGTAGSSGPITCPTGGSGGGGGTAAPACQAPIAITTGTAATVAVNLGTVRNTVSPDLMGIHTSVYDNNMQLCSTIPLLKAAGVTSLRYPGGSYADLYHWELNTGTWTPASGGGSNTIYIAANTDFGNFVGLLGRLGANALITVNYGMNSAGTHEGRPQEAAAWVAYANGSPSSTTSIGVDADNVDWKTVGYWASLRAATPINPDDGKNFLRIGRAAPVGIKYWEVGNELYGNGYYYGGCGWEADMHVAYPAGNVTSCPAGRQANAMLSPATYGAGVKAFSIAMKAVDPTIKIGGIVAWPTATQYQTWNAMVLSAACANMDFAVEHWYAGKTLATLPSVPGTDIVAMFNPSVATSLRSQLTNATNCPANMPVAITEWGPNTNSGNVVIPPSTVGAAPVGSQIVGLFAAEAYANFMEQGVIAAHWLELHNNSYLAGIDLTNDPFTTANDTPRWGYHGALMAHYLASGNDKMVQATVTGTGIMGHASLHADGSVSVMITNSNASGDANVTVSISGGSTTLGCVGTRYAYTPVNSDQDGAVTSAPIFASSDGLSVPVGVPAYSTVVVSFPTK